MMHFDDQQPKPDNSDNFELESQFVLRLPSLPAASLRAAIKSGVLNLKDRLTIQIENDMRNGAVRFDGWVLPAKIIDLPTIIESHKTLDSKNFYKTADIAQMMICKEEVDEVKEEVEDTTKKSKDGKDKKYLYPHGITKPLKNVRKKRFRKTLRKKYVDFPEIEKEVKRLLRTDNEAKSVRYEIVNIDEENKNESKDKDASNPATSSAYDVGDLFGGVVSSSDDDDDRQGADDDEASRMSLGFKDYLNDEVKAVNSGSKYTFSQILKSDSANASESTSGGNELDKFAKEEKEAASILESDESLKRLQDLEKEIDNIRSKRMAQQFELDSIENMALRQRFQAIIDDLKNQEAAKKREYDDLKNALKSSM